jgi:hypothetical protein
MCVLAPVAIGCHDCRRFYSNAYTDAEKQDAINLFLGNYVPLPGGLTQYCVIHCITNDCNQGMQSL